MTMMHLHSDLLAQLDAILSSPEGRRIGVLGLGVAGRAMALYLAERGAVVVAADLRDALAEDTELSGQLELRLGEMSEETFADVEALVISPGAHPDQPAVRAVREAGKPIIGELELLGELPSKVVAITGTNGKSTTTALVGALISGMGEEPFVGGNFGESVASWVRRGAEADVAVIELSSFQLETAYRFAPDVSLVLNISHDHADRYDGLEDYALAKRRVLEGQSPEQTTILNADDVRVAAMAEHARGQTLWFSTEAPLGERDGLYLDGDVAKGAGTLAEMAPLPLQHERLVGRHNRQNALAALLIAYALGYAADGWDSVMEAYRGFEGLEHRLEWVLESEGVRYINDSKATNDVSAGVALRAVSGGVILLAGGRSKNAGYGALLEAAQSAEVIKVFAFGEAGPEIHDAFGAAGFQSEVCTGLSHAVERAVAEASSGQCVLLSPACSSFDEFANYAERGRSFKEFVRDATEGRA